jgi:hypothetical protein
MLRWYLFVPGFINNPALKARRPEKGEPDFSPQPAQNQPGFGTSSFF